MDKMTAEQALVPLAELFKEREAVFAAMRNMSSDDSLDYGYTDRVADIEAEVLAIISALSAPRVPVGWMVARERDPTFPRFYGSKLEAQRAADFVTVNPTPSIHPLYMLAASPEPVAQGPEVENLKYKAALYDEVVEIAKNRGHFNVTNLISAVDQELQEQRAEVERLRSVIAEDYRERQKTDKEQPAQQVIADPSPADDMETQLAAKDWVIGNMQLKDSEQEAEIADLRAEVEALKLELHNVHVDRALAESEVEALREVIGELISAATLGANWMRFWIDHSECDCEDGHHCGVNKRMEEVEKIERAIKKADAARLREGGA